MNKLCQFAVTIFISRGFKVKAKQTALMSAKERPLFHDIVCFIAILHSQPLGLELLSTSKSVLIVPFKIVQWKCG